MIRLPISVCLVAGNEAHRIRPALDSVQGWTSEIILAIDDQVADGTDKIAASYGAKIFSPPWRGHAVHRNFASAQATQPWLLAIDADEVVPPGLRDEIIRLFEQNNFNPPCAAYRFPRCTFYYGRWIRHGDWYPDRQTRLWQRGRADWGDKQLHETLTVDGATGDLKNDLQHHSMESLDHHVRKSITYSNLFAQQRLERGKNVSLPEIWFRSWWRFVRGYILRRGFLDGWQGYVIARMIAQETFLRYAKVRAAQAGPKSKSSRHQT